jgi:hypothetical protein
MKRTFNACLLAVLLLLSFICVFTGVVWANPVWANAPDVPQSIVINSDGSVEPESAPIVRVGSVYTLTADIYNASLIIKADNVVVDGAGFLLDGPGPNYNYRDRGYFVGVSVVNLNNVTLQNFVIKAYDYGVMIAYSSSVQLVDNSIFETVYICNASSTCLLAGNEFSRVELRNSNNVVTLNNFTLPNSCLYVEGNNNQITNNLFNATICLAYSQNNRVSNNIIFDYIQVRGNSSGNEVFSNQIDYPNGYGLTICNSFNNCFYNNTIKNCQIGIILADSLPSWGYSNSSDNLFYQNTLINNTKNAYFSQYKTDYYSFNSWDYNNTGNYYSDYNGTDANGDGIGDTPYVISLNNQDNYPLMKPVNADDAEPVEPFPASVLFVACAVPIAVTCLGLTAYLRKKRGNGLEVSEDYHCVCFHYAFYASYFFDAFVYFDYVHSAYDCDDVVFS